MLDFITTLRSAYEKGVRVRAKMNHNFASGGSINWAQLETLFGIPVLNGNSVGDTANGKIVFTFVDGAIGAMEGTFQNSANKDITETVG